MIVSAQWGGDRDGFPKPLLVSGKNGDASDYATQAVLADACVNLGCRRRMSIPIAGYRYDTGQTPSLLLPFIARRENFSTTIRVHGFYVADAEGGCRVLLEAQITTPVLAPKTILMPSSHSADGTEFAVDFNLGDGSETAYGSIVGYIALTVQDRQSVSMASLVLYGAALDPAPSAQVEVTT